MHIQGLCLPSDPPRTCKINKRAERRSKCSKVNRPMKQGRGGAFRTCEHGALSNEAATQPISIYFTPESCNFLFMLH